MSLDLDEADTELSRALHQLKRTEQERDEWRTRAEVADMLIVTGHTVRSSG